jgi:hypothetical protein
MIANHPNLDHRTLIADAVTAVREFHETISRDRLT